MPTSNKRALAGPPSFCVCPVSAAEEGKAMWYISAEPSSGWKLIALGGWGRVLISSGVSSLERLIEQAHQPQCQLGGGPERAAVQGGAAAACVLLGFTTWGARPFEEKHSAGLILIRGARIFLQKKRFFNFGKHEYINSANIHKYISQRSYLRPRG